MIAPIFYYPESLALFYRNAFESLGATIGGQCTSTSKVWGAEGFKPDIALFIKGECRPELVKEMKQAYGCKTCLYFPDPLETYTNYESAMGLPRNNFDHLKFVRSWYDSLFLACFYPKRKFELLNAKWLPVAIDETIHYPMNPRPSKSIDLLFIGTFKPGRRFIADLKPAPQVYGNGWGDFWKTSAVYLDQKRVLTCQAKVVFNEHHLERGPNHRVLESLACGSFVLSDYVDGMHELGFYPYNVGRYEHGNVTQAQEQITYFLEHEEERERIARAGYELVTKKHSYRQRVLEMMKTI